MTDRELLERAAKAAGLLIELDAYLDYGGFTAYRIKGTGWYWNALHNDGDALRLVVKLGLEVRIFHGKSHVGRANHFWFTEHHNDTDPYAATRRAIVRAAAALSEGEGNAA